MPFNQKSPNAFRESFRDAFGIQKVWSVSFRDFPSAAPFGTLWQHFPCPPHVRLFNGRHIYERVYFYIRLGADAGHLSPMREIPNTNEQISCLEEKAVIC